MDTKKTKNPITELRERLGMSRIDFAKLTGVGYGILSHAEGGYLSQLPPSVLDALESQGADREDAQAQYKAWREQEQSRVEMQKAA